MNPRMSHTANVKSKPHTPAGSGKPRKDAGGGKPRKGAGGGQPRRATTTAAEKPRDARRSAPRRNSVCPLAHECGACSAIDVPYDRQLARKQHDVEKLFAELAAPDCRIMPIAGMAEPFHYRNKIASPFAPGRTSAKAKGAPKAGKGRKGNAAQRDVLCGMFAVGTHRIIALPECPVEHPIGRQIIAAVRSIMLKFGIEPYDEDADRGFIRHVVVRVGHESGEVLVTLVTRESAFPGGRNFARELHRRCPAITTVVQNVNTRITNAILGNEEHVLFGPGFILDTLCGLSFRISSHSFYQVNSVQTEVLYRAAIAVAGLDAPANDQPGARPLTVLDAYCGTGTIGLVAASQAQGVQVIGVDNVASAVRDARQNAQHNGIENAEFVVADAGEFMLKRAAEGGHVDVLMMDPPRAGASEEFLRATLALAPQRIVYISCNPETQARDITVLKKGGYRMKSLQAVDMFPHTDHVETVVLMSKAK